jgi:hypothetical protein
MHLLLLVFTGGGARAIREKMSNDFSGSQSQLRKLLRAHQNRKRFHGDDHHILMIIKKRGLDPFLFFNMTVLT